MTRPLLGLALLITIAGSNLSDAQEGASFPGRVQRVGGTGVAHATVHVEGAGSTVTTDSGEFQFDPPKNVHVGEIVIFHVVNWVITSPCELINGRVYLHTPKEPMEIYVLPLADPLLTATSANLIPCIIEERTANLRLGIGGASTGAIRKTGRTLTHVRAKQAEYNPDSRGRLLRASYDPNSESSPEPSSQSSTTGPSDDPFLVQKASELGIAVNQLKSAIDAWKASAHGPYQQGLAELYDGQFTDARKHIQEALEQPDGDILARYVLLGAAAYGEGDYAAAEKSFRKVLLTHPDDPIVLNNLAVVLTTEGQSKAQYDEAESLYLKAMALTTRERGSGDPDLAANQHNLAELYLKTGQYPKAKYFSAIAMQLETKLYTTNDWRVAEDFECLGLISSGLGNIDDAIKFDLQAKSIYSETGKSEGPSFARVLNNLAEAYADSGKSDLGYPLSQRAVMIGERVLPLGDSDLATYRANLGMFELRAGHDEKAKRLFQSALLSHSKNLGSASEAVAQDYFNLGTFYFLKRTSKKDNDFKKAAGLFEKALNIAGGVLKEDNPGLVKYINSLGTVYFFEERYPAARREYQLALSIDIKMFGKIHRFVARDLYYLASVSYKLHQYDDAVSQSKKALAIANVAIVPPDGLTESILDGAAASLRALGKKQEAKKYEDQASSIRSQNH